MLALLGPVAPHVFQPVWAHGPVLVRGPPLAPARPTRTAAAPSERYDQQQGRRHKTLTDWAGPLLRTVRRWWPDRALVVVADSTDAAIALLTACQSWAHPVSLIARLRLDAALYEPAPPR